jgi:glycosyltransferase involved in cell wall biosynthesis
MLIQRNRAEPYQCIFQWAFSEVMGLGRFLDELPPLIVYPGVHAAGELRWHRRESRYARKSESAFMHYLVRAFLSFRAFYQRYQLRKPAVVLGLSRRFNELVAADYGVDSNRFEVLRHPIASASATPPNIETKTPIRSAGPSKLLFVGRISVRKGIEQIIELSKRLDDLHGQVQLDVVGDRTQWSNYLAHLRDLNPRIARHRGSLGHAETMAAYDDADVLLVPSMYEPGGIVVGEALSRGVCVVASDEVGSAEPIAGDCARIFPAGNIDLFERHVRDLIQELRTGKGDELRVAARREAQKHFDPDLIGRQLLSILQRTIAQQDSRPTAIHQPAALATGDLS